MAISKDEVSAMAKLARLAIDPDDIPGYAEQLSGILAFVARMDEIDTGAVEPLAHPLDLTARLTTRQPSKVIAKAVTLKASHFPFVKQGGE